MKNFFTSAGLLVVTSIAIVAFISPTVGGHGKITNKAAEARLPDTTAPYIPPMCNGRSITRMTRAEMQARPVAEIKLNPPISREFQIRIFNALVYNINKFYVYNDFKNLDWPALIAEFRGKVEAGLNTETFYYEMDQFVHKLGDNHSYFLSPVQYAAQKLQSRGENNYAGIGLLYHPLLKKKCLTILTVNAGSPAEHSGLRQHDSILEVDGLPLVVKDTIFPYIRGTECSAATLKVRSPGEVFRYITVIRSRITGPQQIYARMVPNNEGRRIGYIFLPTFFDITIADQVKKALEDFGPLDGLVLDNRMNSGGLVMILNSLLGYFTSGTVGHFVNRTAQRPVEIVGTPVNNSQKVPLVILVSNSTASSAEMFSGILQDIGRARIVGQTTAGKIETLRSFTFFDSSRAWIATERFDPLKSHSNWQGRGVKPDVEAQAEWDEFTFENDPVLVVALKLLRPR